MPLQRFSFPYPETRFFKSGGLIYKFKIRGGTSCSGEEALKGECFNQELEDIVTTVLGNLNYLKPFSTAHYTAFPYKKLWEKVCKRCEEKKMQFYPFVIILHLEKNIHKDEDKSLITEQTKESRSKCRRRDSPLEEAILKELVKNMEAESNMSVTRKVKLWHQHAEEEVSEDQTLVDEPEMTQDPPDEEGTPGILRRLTRNVLHFIFRTPGTSP